MNGWLPRILDKGMFCGIILCYMLYTQESLPLYMYV